MAEITDVLKKFLEDNFNTDLDPLLTPINNYYIAYPPDPLPSKPLIVIKPDSEKWEDTGTLDGNDYIITGTIDLFIIVGQAKQPLLYTNLMNYKNHLITLLLANQSLDNQATGLEIKETEYFDNFEANENLNSYRIQIEITI